MNIKRLGWSMPFFLILILLVGSCGQQKTDPSTFNTQNNKVTDEILSDTRINDIWDNTVPNEGTMTAYGLSLSLDNTQQYIDWFYEIELNEDEKLLKNSALDTLVAPCCDEYPASEC